MKVCVFGCWHLGTVTAAGLTRLGHHVRCLDPDRELIAGLAAGRAPVAEPGVPEALAQAQERGLVSFTTEPRAVLGDAEVLWVTFDTPVDDVDRGDPGWVIEHVVNVLPAVQDGTTVLISSQLPVGSTAELERRAETAGRAVPFAYAPENLRLGRGLDTFLNPDRLVIGTRDATPRDLLASLLGSITDRLVWVSVESAEMTKHALNAFLATSVTFTNELAVLCEQVGADAREVERALRGDPRVGPRGYVAPGAAFAGGTLARDLVFLGGIGRSHGISTPLLDAVIVSNAAHRGWPLRTLEGELGELAGRRIAVLGLTYTPDTSTLRRSSSIDLCEALVEREALVRVHDPRAESLPIPLADQLERLDSVEATMAAADAIVIATAWPEYRDIPPESFASKLVVDASGLLEGNLRGDDRVRYRTVGSRA